MIKMQIRIAFQETNLQLFVPKSTKPYKLFLWHCFTGYKRMLQFLFRNVKCYILDIPFLLQTLVCQVPLL